MKILIILIFTFFCLIENSFSQLPPCYMKSQQDYNGLTCSFRFYKSSPPLSLDMPENVVRAYLYLDSLGALSKDDYDKFNKQILLEEYNSEKIKEIMKKIMLVKQYDEMRYFLFKNKHDISRYLVFSIIYNSIQRANKCDSLGTAYFQTSAILKITFNDSILRYDNNNRLDAAIYNGTINEIIYGTFCPTYKDLTIPVDSDHYIFNNPETKLIKINDIIQINHLSDLNPLPNIFTNKTYYLFLALDSYCENYDYAFGGFHISNDFDIPTFKNKRVFLFEVNGDVVSDPQHIFTQSGYLTSNQFKSIVLNELDQARKYGTIQRELLRVEENNENQFSIYPNPSSNTLNFKGLSNPETCSIINSIGIQVFNGDINPSTTIDLNSYPIGMYFLKLNNQNFKFEVIK